MLIISFPAHSIEYPNMALSGICHGPKPEILIPTRSLERTRRFLETFLIPRCTPVIRTPCIVRGRPTRPFPGALESLSLGNSNLTFLVFQTRSAMKKAHSAPPSKISVRIHLRYHENYAPGLPCQRLTSWEEFEVEPAGQSCSWRNVRARYIPTTVYRHAHCVE